VIINRGFGGSQICDSTHFIEPLVLQHRPRVVVLYAGDNDIAAGKSADQVAYDFRAFVAAIQAALPETRIVFIAIKPSIARWKLAPAMLRANTLVAAECAKRPRLEFVDVWQPMLGPDGQPRQELFRADGLHLSPAGYILWTRLVRPHLAMPEARESEVAQPVRQR
jgi:lysophospholipase L1-like esterase